MYLLYAPFSKATVLSKLENPPIQHPQNATNRRAKASWTEGSFQKLLLFIIHFLLDKSSILELFKCII